MTFEARFYYLKSLKCLCALTYVGPVPDRLTDNEFPDPALAARVWKRMFALLIASSGARTASLARRGLTPNDARALWSLDEDDGRPIGELARTWRCDPSNATFIVDRLERAGFASRQPAPDDRRVKRVVLTARGAKIRAELDAEYNQPPPEILGLSDDDLVALERVMAKVMPCS